METEAFKKKVETIVYNIVPYAQMAFPNECCGFILEDGSVQPAQNVIDRLNDPSLTQKNAFLIDATSFKLASSKKSPIVCIYHSHTNGDSSMSPADKSFLKWPNLYYLIIGMVDHKPVAAKLFWWEQEILNQTAINI